MKVGLQMYSVNDSMGKDPVGTMERVAQMGYKYWEICQLYRFPTKYNYGMCMSADEAKKLIARLGVHPVASHLSMTELYDDRKLIEYLDFQAAIGSYSPGNADIFFRDHEEAKRKSENLNRVGKMCRERGLKLHFHNHSQEFQKFDGKYILDTIAEYTDPELVDFEMDAYWCGRAGADPIEMMHRYPGRYKYLHVKDFPKDACQPFNMFDGIIDPNIPYGINEVEYGRLDKNSFAEIGTGTIDIQALIDAGNEVGIKYLFVEQDSSKYNDLTSVEISIGNLRSYSGLEWDE